MHSQRLSRQFERTVMQLREFQKIRKTQEKRDLNELVDIMEMCESVGETYEDGFVFSEQQINAAILARHRERRAEEAYDHR